MLRILGLDVGSVRVGVALSDPLGLTAQPLEVIERKRTDVFARIAALVAEHEVEKIVVGHPLHLDGSSGQAAREVERFLDGLRTVVHVPTELWDERLSTAAAERAMIEAGTRREHRRRAIDKVAAALILQAYLDAQRAGA